MKNTTRLATLVLSVAGLGIFSAIPSVAKPATQPSGQPSQSGDATGNCTVSGTVTKDGKPLPDARVALFVKHAHVKTVKKHDRGDAIATATADENGKFTLTDVPAGDYVVIAGLKGDGRGHERVTVTSGQSMTVEVPVSVPGDKTKGGKKLGKLGI
jgi:hypothetical protein